MGLHKGGLLSGGSQAATLGPSATGTDLTLTGDLGAQAIHVEGVEIKAISVPNTTDQSLRFMNSDNTIGWNIAKSAVGTGSDLLINAGGTAHVTFTSATGNVNFRFGIVLNSVLAISTTAPTVSAGFGTGGVVTTSNGTAAFTITIGTGGADSTGTITFPTATTGWIVQLTDITNNALFVTSQTGGNTTTATVTNYSRTTGLATAWTAGDVLRCTAVAY